MTCTLIEIKAKASFLDEGNPSIVLSHLSIPFIWNPYKFIHKTL